MTEHAPAIEIYINGQRAYTVETLAEMLHKSPSSVRSTIHRHKIGAAGYVTGNAPVYYPEDLGLPEEN